MANQNGSPVIFALRDVFFRYWSKGPWVVEGINLDLMHGEHVGIIGDNGAGKSTIAKLLIGMHTPTSGSVKLFGENARWDYHFPLLGYIGDPSYAEGATALPVNLQVCYLLGAFLDLFAR